MSELKNEHLKKAFWIYCDIACTVVALNALLAILDAHGILPGKKVITSPGLMVFLFFYCIVHMFLLAIVGLVCPFFGGRVKRCVLYIASAFAFFYFFLGTSNWDRF
jgi:hypothetical protein